MTESIGWGIGLVLLGGLLNGSFVAPMKRLHSWKWENSWFVYSVSGLLIVAWLVAVAVVPSLGGIFAAASWAVLAKVLAFGFGWGIGSVLFGLGVSRMGLAVGYGIILGLIAPIGTFLPLIVLHSERLWSAQGLSLMLGTLIVLGGIVLCAVAGGIRERAGGIATKIGPRTGYGAGLLICILAGVFSPMLNFSFVFGEELQRRALAAGASQAMASNAIWSLCLTAGFLANAGYAAILLSKNGTWRLFSLARSTPGHWMGGTLMGLLCFASFMTYGAGATALGSLGGIIGWPLFMSMSLITSHALGALTREWAGAPRKAYGYSLAGIGLLVVAITIIARGGNL
jgi:L-rhamnose-H+ transport protein